MRGKKAACLGRFRTLCAQAPVKISVHFLAFCLVLCAALPAAAGDRADTLRAINLVENPTNHTRRGSKGELGPYQFRVQTWRMHTRKPFSLAVVREHADEVAIKHYEWIKRGLTDSGIDPSPFNIAMAWNSGLGAVTNGRVPTVTYNYAERVHNLVEVQQQQRAVASGRASRAKAGVDVALRPAAPRFSLEATPLHFPAASTTALFALKTEPLAAEEPTVYTDRAAPAAAVASVASTPTGTAHAFTLPVATAPRIALLQ